MSQVQMQLAKLKEVERPIIQAIQQEIDNSAKKMASQNVEHQKQKQELEIGKKLAFKSMEKKYQKEIGELEEKYQKETAELEAKNWERNSNFVKEMTSLKEQLKDKINWEQVDLLMGKKATYGHCVVKPTARPSNRQSKKNCWNLKIKNTIFITRDGLCAINSNSSHQNESRWQSISAEKGFSISSDFSGPVLHYFEVTSMSSTKWGIFVGLSNENIPDGTCVGDLPNSYGIHYGWDDCCWLSGEKHTFELPNGAIKPELNGPEDVLGCGLLQNPEDGLSIFFTGNGILMGNQIPIRYTADLLYPTVTMYGYESFSVKANFGDESAKSFKYDTEKCPGLVFK